MEDNIYQQTTFAVIKLTVDSWLNGHVVALSMVNMEVSHEAKEIMDKHLTAMLKELNGG